MGAAADRLTAERKSWRKEHPPGFVAKPKLRPDGTSDILEWECKIPAREKSFFYPALLKCTMTFTDDYPSKPPKVKFDKIGGKPLFHPNVYLDGGVCLSIINPEGSTHAYGKGGTWQPSLTVKHVLLALQIFIDEPESLAAGRQEEERLFRTDKAAYKKKCQEQVKLCESQL